MDDDERIKFNEFEAKESLLKEEREKLRKNLELELRKLRNEIKEICEKFDDKIFVLYRRRLEYDYRVYEQELYIIKLTLSMLIEEDNVTRKEFGFLLSRTLIMLGNIEENLRNLSIKKQSLENTLEDLR